MVNLYKTALASNDIQLLAVDILIENGVITSTFLSQEPIIECCSNVAFLPGIQSIELYREGILNSDRLWAPHNNGDVAELYLDESGQSINQIQVGQSIETAGISLLKELRIYTDLFDSFNQLVEQQSTINEWRDLSYDWRYSPFQVVDKPVEGINGDYNLINEIIDLASTSITGQVTIVAHSNGGLVAKALMMRLAETNQTHLVDKVIFTVPPHLGTPKALASLLHGTDQGIKFILNESTARELARNMPNAYNLLPSKRFFDESDQMQIRFSSDLVTGANYYEKYGDQIDSYAEYQQFLSGSEGRINPGSTDLYTPIIANSDLWDQVIAEHQLLDNWQAPDEVEVYTIVGEGLSTLSGWQYRNKKIRSGFLTTTEVMYPHPIWTNAGDATVVVDSTDDWGEVTYFDQPRYAILYDTGNDANHAELFRSPEVRNYITSLISGSDYESELFNSSPKYRDNASFEKLEISSHSPVNLLASDSDGNQTGIVNGEVVFDIPGSDYIRFAGSDYLLLPPDIEVAITYQYDNSDPDSELSVQFSYRNVTESNQQIEDLAMTEPAIINTESAGVINLTGGELIINNTDGEYIISTESQSVSSGGGGPVSVITNDNNIPESESVIDVSLVAGVSVAISSKLQLALIIFRSEINDTIKRQLIKMLYDQ